jgi:hypothetical protein
MIIKGTGSPAAIRKREQRKDDVFRQNERDKDKVALSARREDKVKITCKTLMEIHKARVI